MDIERALRAADAYLESSEGPRAARLRFLRGLLGVQADIAAQKTRLDLPLAQEARRSLLEGRPVFAAWSPRIDRDEYLSAVTTVARYVSESAGLPEEQSGALAQADFAASVAADAFDASWVSPDVLVARLAESVVAAAPALSLATAVFVLHSALVPFLAASAAETVAVLDDLSTTAWGHGICPVCGDSAGMGRVGESSQLQGADRTLWCGSCHAEWGYARIRCVRCGCKSPDVLRYSFVDGDPAHRLHLCDNCHGYARFTFEDEMRQIISMPVEDAVTAELDGLAREQGYTAAGDGGAASC